jgi:hypothetical protein
MATELVLGFNGGEVSPNLESGVNLDLYPRSCSLLANANPLPEGSAQKRAGTEYVADAIDLQVEPHLKSFNFSDEYSYQIEFGDQVLRIYRVQTRILIEELPSPYTAAEARDVQYERINDVAWFVHPNHPEYILARTSISSFTFAEYEYLYPPMLERDLSGIKMIPNGVSGAIQVDTDGDSFFTESMEGGYLALNQKRVLADPRVIVTDTIEFGQKVNKALGNDDVTDWLWVAFSEFRLATEGATWLGRLSIEVSYDYGVTFEELYFITDTTGAQTENFADFTFAEKQGAKACVRVKRTSGSNALTVTLTTLGGLNYGLVKMDSYISPTEMGCIVVSDLYENSLATGNNVEDWNEGAFSGRNGYARCVTVYEGGRWLSGCAIDPLLTWRSAIDDYANFFPGLRNNEGIRRRPDGQGAAAFFVSKDALILVTTNEVITIQPFSASSAIGPDNIRFVINTGDGAAYAQGELANDAIIFLQKGSKKLRDMLYSDETKGFITNDISYLAKHISKIGITETTLVKLPEQRVYSCLANGQLGIVSYERAEKFVAWHRYETQGEFVSVSAAINGEEDQVWVAVYRNGGYRIEALKSANLDLYWQLDSAVENEDTIPCQIAESIDVGPAPDYFITVTKDAHGLVDGDKVRFQDVTGYDYLEGEVFEVADSTLDTFLLKSADGLVYINPTSFNLDYINGFNAGTLDANGRYDRAPGYGGASGIGYEREITVVPEEYESFAPYFGFRDSNGITDNPIDFDDNNFEFEIEASFTEVPFAETTLFGVGPQVGRVCFKERLGKIVAYSRQMDNSAVEQTFPIMDLTGTPHTYMLERVGTRLRIYYDGVAIESEDATIEANDAFGNNQQLLNYTGIYGGYYQMHRIRVSISLQEVLRFEPQAETGATWFDQSGEQNNFTITTPNWVGQGIVVPLPEQHKYLVSNPIPRELYLLDVPKTIGQQGTATAPINFGDGRFDIEITISVLNVNPDNGESVYGRALFENGSVAFFADSANFGWIGEATDSSNFNMAYQVYPAVGSYDLSGTPHTYKVTREGDTVTFYYDGELIATRIIGGSVSFGSPIMNINHNAGGGGYRIHEIRVTVGLTLVALYGAQLNNGLVLEDQQGSNNITFPSVNWLSLGLEGSVPGWAVSKTIDEDPDTYELLYTTLEDTFSPPRNGYSIDEGLADPIEFDYPVGLNWSLVDPITGTFCNVVRIINNLDHLEGMEVLSLVDDERIGVHTVQAGAVDLNTYAGHAVVGLGYAFLLSPLPIEMYPQANSLGHMKSINNLSLKLKDSYGGKVGTSLAEDKLSEIITRNIEDELGIAPQLFTGDYEINPIDSWEGVKRLYVLQDIPYPFEVLSISMNIEMQGRK